MPVIRLALPNNRKLSARSEYRPLVRPETLLRGFFWVLRSGGGVKPLPGNGHFMGGCINLQRAILAVAHKVVPPWRMLPLGAPSCPGHLNQSWGGIQNG